MIHSTTPTIEGQTIKSYLGVVTGETILGANFLRDFMASITDIIGGRSGVYEQKIEEARKIAFREMEARAVKLGANAIVGIDIDYEVLGQDNGMMMVAVTGTAVVLAS